MQIGIKHLLFAAVAIGWMMTPVSAQSISTYIRTEAPEAHIEIDASQRASFRIPRTVYGTFLEDIGHSVFGGVSAELLDNPSLETYHAALGVLRERFPSKDFDRSTLIGLPLPWLPLHWEDGVRYEPRWGQAANSDQYVYLMGLQGREVGIRQAVYLPIERERTYNGFLFASSSEGPVQLVVSLRKHDAPDSVLASQTVDVPGAGSWHKLAFTLTVPEGKVQPMEESDFVVSVKDEHRVSLDEIRLYPADAVDGLDAEVIKVAKSCRTPLLRYGGNFTSGYHWEDGVGPIDRRPTKLNQAWGYPEFNEFGTDELMNFCRLIDARPQICLNLGSGTAEEARAWVEYCQGGPKTPQGRRRATNGHPQPYPVAAWELGNELWGKDFQIGWQTPQEYAQSYKKFYYAIRSLVPPETMVFANGADIDFFKDWNGALVDHDGADLSFLTSHFVVGTEDRKDEAQQVSRDDVWAADFAIPVGVARVLGAVKAQIDANPQTSGRARLAYTEWLFAAPEKSEYPRWSNLGGALIAAGWMNMLLAHADFIPVSDMTGLLEFGGIYKTRGRVFVAPQYAAFSLYSNYAGDTPVATHTEVKEYDVGPVLRRLPAMPDVPSLDVLATTDSVHHNLTLFVVNRDWKHSISGTVKLKGFVAASPATVRTLTGDSILAENNEERPNAVHPVISTLSLSGDTFHYTFPEHALTMIAFEPK
jgi:alpha-L-arabinofuranosidase